MLKCSKFCVNICKRDGQNFKIHSHSFVSLFFGGIILWVPQGGLFVYRHCINEDNAIQPPPPFLLKVIERKGNISLVRKKCFRVREKRVKIAEEMKLTQNY